MDTILKLLMGWIAMLFVLAVLCLFLAFPTKILWNWLMPAVFSLQEISFAQAFGLLLLCGLLFGEKKVDIQMKD
ncbi:MAG: hypothetical protein AAFV47_07705 [Pseudomonadota bacterium]